MKAKKMIRNKVITMILVIGFGLGLTQFSHASNEQTEKGVEITDGHEAGLEDAGEGGAIKIDPKVAKDMGIETRIAEKGTVSKIVIVTGRIVQNQNTTAEVKARFEGVVKSVAKTQGETVKAGDVLATVESNNSLEDYPVRAPVGGVIIARNINIGHITGSEPLFIIADLTKLWAEFYVFPKDASAVSAGQKIVLKGVASEAQAEISINAMLPIVENDSQTVIARGDIDNRDNIWRPGMSVIGNILTQAKDVDVRIDAAAPQRMDGKVVVFVENGGVFEARPVKLGTSDQLSSEVLEGLQPGENYVAKGSFVLKADAEKSGAEHEH